MTAKAREFEFLNKEVAIVFGEALTSNKKSIHTQADFDDHSFTRYRFSNGQTRILSIEDSKALKAVPRWGLKR